MAQWHDIMFEEAPIRNSDGSLKKRMVRTELQKDRIREMRQAADVQMQILNIPKTSNAKALFQEIREQNARRRSIVAPHARAVRELHYEAPKEIPVTPRAPHPQDVLNAKKALSTLSKFTLGHTTPSVSQNAANRPSRSK